MVYIEGQSERSADEERTLITVKRDKNAMKCLWLSVIGITITVLEFR